jgi:hypothetical protein
MLGKACPLCEAFCHFHQPFRFLELAVDAEPQIDRAGAATSDNNFLLIIGVPVGQP